MVAGGRNAHGGLQAGCSHCASICDEWLPLRVLEAVDAFISKSEPITSVLEKVDYLLSLRFLFQRIVRRPTTSQLSVNIRCPAEPRGHLTEKQRHRKSACVQ